MVISVSNYLNLCNMPLECLSVTNKFITMKAVMLRFSKHDLNRYLIFTLRVPQGDIASLKNLSHVVRETLSERLSKHDFKQSHNDM